MRGTRGAAAVAALGLLLAAGGEVAGAAPEAAPAATFTFDGEAGMPAGITESANASVAAASAKRGNGGLRIAAANAAGYARWGTSTVPQGHGYASARTWVRVTSRGANESVDLLTVQNTQGIAHFDFFVNGLTQRFQWDLWREDVDESSFTVVYDRWYLVEAQIEFDGTQHSAQVRIDGVPQGTITSTGDPSAVRQFQLGTTVAKTHVQHYDDVELQVGGGPLGWLADTPPQVSLTRPVDGAVYGDDQVVVADFACTATDHTIASCTGTTADGAAIDTDVPGTRSFTVTGTDVAGYRTTRTVSYTVVDDDDPAVAVTSPADGLVVARGSRLVADFACEDDAGGPLLGADRCVGSAADGAALDTTTLGDHPFTVTATDPAGNQTVWTGTYTVARNRPDVHLRSTSRARFGGDDVYSATGARQTVQATVGAQGAASFLVRVENDGDAEDTFRLRANRARPGWIVRWYAGSREVSAAVHAGTYRIEGLAPGATRVLRLVVRPKPGSTTARQDVLLTATAGGATDAVKVIAWRR